MPRLIVTGSSGLIGSEAVTRFDSLGWDVVGIDNNLRADFFGPIGDTSPTLRRLRETTSFRHVEIDIRDRGRVRALFQEVRPDCIIHCAAQPSHDLAAKRPFDDFDVNAVGTLNLLEATRVVRPDAVFIYMSTNKVYGDAPNEIPLVEIETRFDYARAEDFEGVDESCRIDQSLHSLFGASKAAADLLTQEYGRYFQMKTVCFRGGCLTGPQHAGVELHGFLNYLVATAVKGGVYKVYGYKGKQVRDQIHSRDVIAAMEAFIAAPKCGAVYNLGGRRESHASLLECVAMIEEQLGRRISLEFVEQNRIGDHICYISNMAKFRRDYPNWRLTTPVRKIIAEIIAAQQSLLDNGSVAIGLKAKTGNT